MPLAILAVGIIILFILIMVDCCCYQNFCWVCNCSSTHSRWYCSTINSSHWCKPELMVLAVGAGSVIFSPPNDPGFWLFKEFFGLTIKGTIRTWCALETIISVAGIIGVMILNAILF